MQDDTKAVKILSNLIANTIQDSTAAIKQDILSTKKEVKTLQRRINLLSNVNFENYYMKADMNTDMQSLQETLHTDITNHDYDIKALLNAIAISINEVKNKIDGGGSGGDGIIIAVMDSPAFNSIITSTEVCRIDDE